jgi:hypothetical protein
MKYTRRVNLGRANLGRANPGRANLGPEPDRQIVGSCPAAFPGEDQASNGLRPSHPGW